MVVLLAKNKIKKRKKDEKKKYLNLFTSHKLIKSHLFLFANEFLEKNIFLVSLSLL